MLNSRKIKDELNIFSGILTSHMYLSVFAVIVLLQARPARVQRAGAEHMLFCVSGDGRLGVPAVTASPSSLVPSRFSRASAVHLQMLLQGARW